METMEYKQNFLEIAHENFSRWNEALQTRDAKKVAELYSKDATFLPTMSGDFKFGQEGAKDYFEDFLLANPRGKIVEEKIQPMGERHYSYNGMYNFEVGAEGRRLIKECRFTFNWVKDEDGQWKILHQHSSSKPKE